MNSAGPRRTVTRHSVSPLACDRASQRTNTMRCAGGSGAGPPSSGSSAGSSVSVASRSVLTPGSMASRRICATLTMRRSMTMPRPAARADSTLRTTCFGLRTGEARMWISSRRPKGFATTRAETTPASEQRRRSTSLSGCQGVWGAVIPCHAKVSRNYRARQRIASLALASDGGTFYLRGRLKRLSERTRWTLAWRSGTKRSSSGEGRPA